MDRDPLDLPTSPTLSPIPASQVPWPGHAGGPPPQPPRRRPPWPLLGVIGAGLAVALITSLLVALLLTTRGGTTTVLLGAAEQTATSAQATSTAEGTPPTSPAGTAGTGGISGPRATSTPRPPGPTVHVVNVQGHATVYGLTTSCPTDELALSGGWSADANTRISVSDHSSVQNTNGWTLDAREPNAPLTAYVLCLQHLAGASITSRSAAVTIATDAASTVVASCQAGETLIGGGFFIDVGDITHFSPTADHTGFSLTVVYRPSLARTHAVSSRYHAMVTPYAHVTAQCLSAARARLTVPSPATVAISPQGSGPVTVTCPKGTLLSGGGIDLLNGIAVATEFAPSSATTWQAQVRNQTIVSTTVKLYALCLSFS